MPIHERTEFLFDLQGLNRQFKRLARSRIDFISNPSLPAIAITRASRAGAERPLHL